VTLMGLGFVVARFGFVLDVLDTRRSPSSKDHSTTAAWIGIMLVLIGSIMMAAAAWEHRLYVRRLDRIEPFVQRTWLSDVAAAVLAALGLGVAAYLFLTSH
jgi:putative membrane protein